MPLGAMQFLMNAHTLTYCPLDLANTSWLRSQTLAKKHHCTTKSMGNVCTKRPASCLPKALPKAAYTSATITTAT